MTTPSTLTSMWKMGLSSKRWYQLAKPRLLCHLLSRLLLLSLIRQIGENLVVPSGVRLVNAHGQLVIPGGVDANTNLLTQQKGLRPVDDLGHGSRAALSGGTTTISLLIIYHFHHGTFLPGSNIHLFLQLTMFWWSQGLVYCQRLMSGRRLLIRRHAATSLYIWTLVAGMRAWKRSWRRWWKIKVIKYKWWEMRALI